MLRNQEELCLSETKDSITSISTTDYVPQPVNEKSHIIRNRIFVGNFPDSATHKDISSVFCIYGKIIETNIVDSPNSMARYGFVTFQNIAVADEVIRLSSQGKEFKVKGKVVTINRALFKPKKHSCNKFVLNASNSQSIMVVDGRPVVALFANGMAYFQPVNEEKVLQPPHLLQSQISTLCQKSIRTYSPFTPRLHFANQYQIPTRLTQTNPVYQLPALMTPKNLNSNISVSPLPSGYPNLHLFVPAQAHQHSSFVVTSM